MANGLGFVEPRRKPRRKPFIFETFLDVPEDRRNVDSFIPPEDEAAARDYYGPDWPIYLYKGHGYGRINSNFRDDGIGGPVGLKLSDRLDRRQPFTGTVYRGIFGPKISETTARIDAMQPGDIFEDPGFMSTSKGLGHARMFGAGDHVMAIRTRGKRGSDISRNINPAEQEVLFNAGSRFSFIRKMKIKRPEARQNFTGSNRGRVTVYLFEEVD